MGRQELTRLTGNGNGECGEDDCPNVYRTERGTFVVQGDVTDAFMPLETLPQYLVPQEAAEIEASRSGIRIDPHTYSSPYADDDLKRLYGEGKRKGRVHILTPPRSAYLCFEFSRYYEPHAAAGENILTKLPNASRSFSLSRPLGGPWSHPWPYRPKPTQPRGPHSTPARS